jgi:uncharacterized protein YbaA (DUF1428 family)
MKHPKMLKMMADMKAKKNVPFDDKRMFWGGFKAIVEM